MRLLKQQVKRQQLLKVVRLLRTKVLLWPTISDEPLVVMQVKQRQKQVSNALLRHQPAKPLLTTKLRQLNLSPVKRQGKLKHQRRTALEQLLQLLRRQVQRAPVLKQLQTVLPKETKISLSLPLSYRLGAGRLLHFDSISLPEKP